MKKLITLTVAALLFSMSASAAELIDDVQVGALVDKRMKAIDASGDGFISKDEYVVNAEKKFSDNDIDKDEKLSRDELLAIKMKEVKDLSK